jgi:hypothetical protein
MNLPPLIADALPFHRIPAIMFVEEPESGVVVVVQIKKGGFPVPVSVAHLARPNMHAPGVEGIDILRIPSSTIEIHGHAACQVHCDGRAVITAPLDGTIHLVKELAECLRELRKRFVHGRVSIGDGL